MQTIFVEVSNDLAMNELQSMQSKKLIKIINPNFESLSLPGKPISITAFKKWIKDAENVETISLNEAKKRWANKKKKLQALIH